MKPKNNMTCGNKKRRIEYRNGFKDPLWKPFPEPTDSHDGMEGDDQNTENPPIRVFRLCVHPESTG